MKDNNIIPEGYKPNNLMNKKKMTPLETLEAYWGFTQQMAAAKHEHDRLEEEIESLHNIMATPELMEIWLDGKHMEAHTLSVKMMEQFAQATADATKEEE